MCTLNRYWRASHPHWRTWWILLPSSCRLRRTTRIRFCIVEHNYISFTTPATRNIFNRRIGPVVFKIYLFAKTSFRTDLLAETAFVCHGSRKMFRWGSSTLQPVQTFLNSFDILRTNKTFEMKNVNSRIEKQIESMKMSAQFNII